MAELRRLGRDIRLAAVVERYEVVEGASTASESSAASAVKSGIGALKARISLSQTGQHVDYTLDVAYAGRESWKVKRRFNEFAALHDVLKKRLYNPPEPPAKSVVRHFNPEYLEGRKAALSEYLGALCRRRDALNCREVQEFFCLPERIPAFAHNAACEPAQLAEIQDPSFGIRAVSYDPERGLLLIGATEMSTLSRLDTKITNIRLPWEPEAPDLPTSQMSLWRHRPDSLSFEMLFLARYTPSLTSVVLTWSGGRGMCLCGLSDGTIGCHPAEPTSGPTQRTLPLLRHTAGVSALAADDDSAWLYSASKDGALMVYDLPRNMIQCEVQPLAPVSVMLYHKARKRLFTGLQNGRCTLWDTSILPIQPLCTVPDGVGTDSKVSALDYDAAAETLFVGTKEGVTLWAMKSTSSGSWGRRLGQITTLPGPPTALSWSASSKEVIAGFANGAVLAFDVEKAEASYALQSHPEDINCIQWLEDGARRLLVTGSKDKTVKIWSFPCLPKTDEADMDEAPAQPPIAPVVSSYRGVKGPAPPRAPGSDEAAAVRGAGPPVAGPRPAEPPALAGVPPSTRSSAAAPGAARRVPQSEADSDDDGLAGWDK